MIPNVRFSAMKAIEAALENTEAAERSPTNVEALSPEDRRLMQEISFGVLREWGFLLQVIALKAKRMPKGRGRTLLAMGAYQLLFLDRVPGYAIFAETKKIGELLLLSEPETKFIHAILKTVERDKEAILKQRAEVLARLREGHAPEDEFQWGVLNASPSLVDSLSVVDAEMRRKDARPRAVKALAAMRERSSLVGYALPGETPTTPHHELQSTIAPRALEFESGEGLQDDLSRGAVRVQGEASQWACEWAAEFLEKRVAGGAKKVRILEMAAGKGGKLLGTLAAWSALRKTELPEIEWLAVDSSSVQLQLLETEGVPLVRKKWPRVNLQIQRLSWAHGAAIEAVEELGPFDLVWLDAPCTGFGTLAKLPQIALVRGEAAYEEAKRLALLQTSLCEVGLKIKAKGGALFYTVCTMTRPETYDVVEFCQKTLGATLERMETLWPGSPPAPRAEGFFAAMLN